MRRKYVESVIERDLKQVDEEKFGKGFGRTAFYSKEKNLRSSGVLDDC